MTKITDEKIKAYALKNAIAHDGKANPGSVISALFNEGLKKDKVKEIIPRIKKIIKEIEKFSKEKQFSEFEKIKEVVSERNVREGLPELPKVKKTGVIMRFAPSASGPMHMGHAMTACLSYLYFKKYGGKFYVRIEDTNPENSFKDSYKLLEDDAKWLFNNEAEIVVQSDRIEEGIYYKYAEKLIKKGSAYVCECSGDEFRNFSKMKKPCPCRKNSIKTNLEKWDKMLSLKREYKEGEAVLRFKSSMTHKNPAMRDFPLARLNYSSHPRHGSCITCWPLMNLAVAVDDIEEKMTHIIRAKDHRDNSLRQAMIYEALGLKKKIPWAGFLGRYHFKDLELSTTKFREGIKSGKYSGWDDENLPTLCALRKKGYKPNAFYKFAERVGLSENDKVIDKKEFFTLLDDFNKDKNL